MVGNMILIEFISDVLKFIEQSVGDWVTIND